MKSTTHKHATEEVKIEVVAWVVVINQYAGMAEGLGSANEGIGLCAAKSGAVKK